MKRVVTTLRAVLGSWVERRVVTPLGAVLGSLELRLRWAACRHRRRFECGCCRDCPFTCK